MPTQSTRAPAPRRWYRHQALTGRRQPVFFTVSSHVLCSRFTVLSGMVALYLVARDTSPRKSHVHFSITHLKPFFPPSRCLVYSPPVDAGSVRTSCSGPANTETGPVVIYGSVAPSTALYAAWRAIIGSTMLASAERWLSRMSFGIGGFIFLVLPPADGPLRLPHYWVLKRLSGVLRCIRWRCRPPVDIANHSRYGEIWPCELRLFGDRYLQLRMGDSCHQRQPPTTPARTPGSGPKVSSMARGDSASRTARAVQVGAVSRM